MQSNGPLHQVKASSMVMSVQSDKQTAQELASGISLVWISGISEFEIVLPLSGPEPRFKPEPTWTWPKSGHKFDGWKELNQ